MFPRLKNRLGGYDEITDVIDFNIEYTEGTYAKLSFSLPMGSTSIPRLPEGARIDYRGRGFFLLSSSPPDSYSSGSSLVIKYEFESEMNIVRHSHNSQINTSALGPKELLDIVLNKKAHATIVGLPSHVVYTVDGTTPTIESPKYTAPIQIDKTATINMLGIDILSNQTDIISNTYVIDESAKRVQAAPTGSSFTTAQYITLLLSGSGDIYYTLDGTAPTPSSLKYTDPIYLDHTCTLKFIATDPKGNVSPIYSETYTISISNPEVALSHPEGLYPGPQSVELDHSIAGEIHYIIGTGDPTSLLATIYSGPISVSTDTTINYVLKHLDNTFSTIYTATFRIDKSGDCAIPYPSEGKYNTVQRVRFRNYADLQIHYTLDGKTPDENSPLYSDTVVIDKTTLLSYICIDTNGVKSTVKAKQYTVIVPPTDISLDTMGGTYNKPQTITITDTKYTEDKRIAVSSIYNFKPGSRLLLEGKSYEIKVADDLFSEPEIDKSTYDIYAVHTTLAYEETPTFIPTIIGHYITLDSLPPDTDLQLGNMFISELADDPTGLSVGYISPSILEDKYGNLRKRVLRADSCLVETNLTSIADAFNGILNYNTENLSIELRSEDDGTETEGARYGVNLISCSKVTDDANFITRLWCYGKDGLTFGLINPQGAGKSYLEDFSYIEELNDPNVPRRIVEDKYENTDCVTPEDLLLYSQIELSRRSRPRFSYRVKCVDVPRLTNTDLESSYKLFDKVHVVDPLKKIDAIESVVRVLVYPLYPEKTEMDLKNKQLTITDVIRELRPRITQPDPVLPDVVNITPDTTPPGPVRNVTVSVVNSKVQFPKFGYAYRVSWINPSDKDWEYTTLTDGAYGPELRRSYSSVDYVNIELEVKSDTTLYFHTYDANNNVNHDAGTVSLSPVIVPVAAEDTGVKAPAFNLNSAGKLVFDPLPVVSGQTNINEMTDKQVGAVSTYLVNEVGNGPKFRVSADKPDDNIGKDGDFWFVITK